MLKYQSKSAQGFRPACKKQKFPDTVLKSFRRNPMCSDITQSVVIIQKALVTALVNKQIVFLFLGHNAIPFIICLLTISTSHTRKVYGQDNYNCAYV